MSTQRGVTLRVAIVGGGPAGLVAAVAARRFGLDVELFEQTAQFGHVGAAIGLARNGLRALDAVGVLDELRPRLTPIPRGTLRGSGGRVITSLDLNRGRHPATPYMVLRSDLIDALSGAAAQAGAVLRLGRRCVATNETGSLRFADGAEVKADVILAADGVNSVLRSSFAEPGGVRSLGWSATRALVAAPAPGEPREIWLQGRAVLFAPVAEQTYLALMARNADWNEFRGQDYNAWKGRWSEFGPDVMSLIDAVEDWSAVAFDEIREVRLRRWYKPPVFLLGDAAHAMSPDIGQGGNSAMVDAVVLVRLLAEARESGASLDDVGRQYEAIRRRFVTQLQMTARIGARMRFASSSSARMLRDVVLKVQGLGPAGNATVRQWGGYNRKEESYLMPMPADRRRA